MIKTAFSIAFFTATVLFTTPSFSAEQVKFGKTCVSTSSFASDVCVSFDGKTAYSTYKHKKKYASKGTHTGCSVSASSIKCSGGRWQSGGQSGKQNPVTIKLSKGKPVSMSWGG